MSVLFYVNGVLAASRVRFPSLMINDVLGAQPNTGALVFDTVAPSIGDAVAIYWKYDAAVPMELLFAGEIQNLEATYQSDARKAALAEWPVDLIDPTFPFNKRRPFMSFIGEVATSAAQYLIANWAPGFTWNHVQAGLPLVTINFDGSQTLIECLNAIAQAIGGRVKVDYLRDVHLFIPPEPGLVPPDPIGFQNPPLNTPPIRWTVDLSQVRTRVYGRGHGEQIPADINIGETILPVDDTVFFNAAGGRAIASLTSDGAQTQQLTYAGTQVGGVGSVVGPGAAPSSPPTVIPIQGSGLLNAGYWYGYSWVTALGETLISPIGAVSCGPLANPTIHPTLNAPTTGPGPDAGLHYYGYSFVTGSGETLALTSTNSVTTSNNAPAAPPGYYSSSQYTQNTPFAGMLYAIAATYVNASGGESALGAPIYGLQVGQTGTGGSASYWTYPLIGPVGALPSGAIGMRLYASMNANPGWHRLGNWIGSGGNPFPPGGECAYWLGNDLTYFYSQPGPSTPVIAAVCQVAVTQIPLGPPGTTARRIYRTPANAAYAPANFKLAGTINDNVGSTFIDSVVDSSLTGALPASNTTAVNQANLSAIAVGPAEVTSRKLYRTQANGAVLKLLAVIGNNTQTTYGPDNASDAGLGANAPTIDTSQLKQPTGQVNPGATSIPTAGASPFISTGGWVQCGQQFIRYTGVTTNALTGIPISGSGSITTSIQYNAQIVSVPALTGVSGIARGILKGSSVSLFVQRDDLAAQAALGQLERTPSGGPTDGIREFLLVDERRGEPSLIDYCDAELAHFAHPIIGVTYHCRDPKAHAGSTVSVAFADGVFNPQMFNANVFHTGKTTYGYAGEFLIQSVTITFDAAPQLLPRYAVTASSSKFTFADLLQRVLIAS